MTIAEALRDNSNDLFIACCGRWLYADDEENWIVYEKKPGQKNTTLIVKTKSEDESARALIRKERGSRCLGKL